MFLALASAVNSVANVDERTAFQHPSNVMAPIGWSSRGERTGGLVFSILRVNMATRECRFEEIAAHYAGLGGRALASAIVAREVDPLCSPLGPRNKLVLAPGLLGGAKNAYSNRISVGCKSPMTGGLKECNSGGRAGGLLARLGILAVILEDSTPAGEWFQLEIAKGSARLVPAVVAGLNNYSAVECLVRHYGDSCGYVTIGRAGEFGLPTAGIAFTDRELRPARHAGRGGVGAVMGSKGLKAIIIHSERGARRPFKDEKAFTDAVRRFAAALAVSPVRCQGLPAHGADAFVSMLHEAGGLSGPAHVPDAYAGEETGPSAPLSTSPGPCVAGARVGKKAAPAGAPARANQAGGVGDGVSLGCTMRCGGPYSKTSETSANKRKAQHFFLASASQGGTDDAERISRYSRMCDDLGVDALDVGRAIAVAVEAGAVSRGEGALKLLQEIDAGSPLGRVIGSGPAIAGQVFGAGRPPGCGRPEPGEHPGNRRSVAASVDAMGLCQFVAFAVLDDPTARTAIVDMLNAKYGFSLTADDVLTLGDRILEMERGFNRRAGIGDAGDR